MLNRTDIRGERIVATFPIIGGNPDDRYLYEAFVLTTDDNGGLGGKHTFTMYRVSPQGEVLNGYPETFKSFPAALRTARKQAGWG